MLQKESTDSWPPLTKYMIFHGQNDHLKRKTIISYHDQQPGHIKQRNRGEASMAFPLHAPKSSPNFSLQTLDHLQIQDP